MLSQLQRVDTYQVADQALLLREISNGDGDLAKELARQGLSYDDLVYKTSGPRIYTGLPPLTLEDISSSVSGVPLVSFFTGCGGLDLGFEAVGYSHVASFEINELFCKTLRRNRPNWKVFGPPVHSGDVSKFEEVADTLRGLIKAPFEGVFAGGPPCQPFSIAANQRFAKWGDNFKRTGFAHAKNGNLLFDFVRLIVEFQPRAFVIENVPGLRDLDGGEQLNAAISELTSAGYNVSEPRVLDAAQLGVPQQRQRLFVVGSRGPGEYHPPASLNYTVGSGSVLFRSTVGTNNHETRDHKAASVLRYMELGYGARDQLGRVDRLDPRLPSKTVIAGGTAGGGRSHLHPEIPRTLSVRECARLQTFPDTYEFVGATARQFTQVGNAVPPVLGAWVGKALAEAYFGTT
jgi:DNA (cytosine-5)-methyltransferase 1